MTLEFRIRLGNELVNIRGVGSSWLYGEILHVARQMDGFHEPTIAKDIERMVKTGILSQIKKFDDDPPRNTFRYVVESPRYFPKVVGIELW